MLLVTIQVNSYSGSMKVDNKSITMMKVGVFLALLAETYLNAALPSLMATFGVPRESVQWLTSLYILTMGLSVPISAFLINTRGTKELFVGSLTLFFIGTIGGGFAFSFPTLLIARIIQAVGASVTLPLMIHSIMVSYEKQDRGKAMGSAMLVVLFAPAIGPAVGALVMQLLSWRWIFFTTSIVIALILIWGQFNMKEETKARTIKVDYLSIVLSIIGFGGFVYGLQRTLSNSPHFGVSIGITLVGVLSITWFILRQRVLDSPMLDLSPFASSTFSLGSSLIIICHMAVFGSFILLPMYLVEVIGVTPLKATIAMIPGGFIGALAPSLAGRMYDTSGPKRVAITGFVLLSVANILIAQRELHTSVTIISLIYVVLLSGFGLTLTPIKTHSLSQLEPKMMGSGTAILNTAMLISSSIGGSLFVALMASKAQVSSFVRGFTFSYWIAAAVSLIGVILSLFFRSSPDLT